MKSKIISFAFCLMFLIPIHQSRAQDSLFNKRIYKVWLSPMDYGSEKIGVLFQNKESSIVLSNSTKRENYLNDQYTTTAYYIDNIEALQLRKVNNKKKGTLIGLAAGALIGAMMANMIMQSEPVGPTMYGPNSSYKAGAIITAVLVAGAGTGIGAGVGGIRITIPINGDKKTYQEQRERLNKYALKKSK